MLEAHPEATKHMVPEGQRNVPIDSPLIRQEISKHIEETWIPTRIGPFPIDKERSRPGSTVIFSNSITAGYGFNPKKFREISSVIKDDGSLQPIHVLPHNNEQRYFDKMSQERNSPKVRCEIKRDEEHK